MKHLLFLGIAFAAFHVSLSNIPEFCNLPPDEGAGPNFDHSLYYDKELDGCFPFIFHGGSTGNGNRFRSEKECIRNCSVNAEDIYPLDETKACHLPLRKGSSKCSLQLVRYHYNAVYDKCKRFLYTGCEGNGNRFTTVEICNATCFGIHDDGDEADEPDLDTPIAIILGVLIALIVAGVLITVIVFTVKSKKKKSKKKAAAKRKEPNADLPLQDQGIEMT